MQNYYETAKLNWYGIRGFDLKLFAGYLADCVQCVKIGTCLSEIKILNVGVPQGPILGPILFSLYTKDLPCVTNRFRPFFLLMIHFLYA